MPIAQYDNKYDNKSLSNQGSNCKREDSNLPKPLSSILPSCAEFCVASYVQQFWVPQQCANSTDTVCLCRKYSGTGYTLGEISLACVSSSCPQAPAEQASRIFNICVQHTDAVTATHSILTVLVSSNAARSTSVPSPTSATRNQTTTTDISPTTRSGGPSTLQTAAAVTSIGSGVPIVTSIIAPLSSPSPQNAVHSSQLTSGQAAGITVGAFGGVGVIAALVFCCICVRRRKRKDKETKENKKRDSLDFVCAETPRFPSDNQLPRRNQRTSEGSDFGLGDHRATQWPLQGTQRAMNHPTNHARSISRSSVYSDRTVSRLLPAQPSLAASQSTHRQLQNARPYSTQTQGTVFEEDRQPWSPGLQRPAPIQVRGNAQAMHTARNESARPVGIPRMIRPDSRQSTRNLNLILQIPKQETSQSELADEVDASKGARNGAHSAGNSAKTSLSAIAGPATPASSATSYIPAYYTSNESRTPMIPYLSPSTPRMSRVPFRTPPPAKPLPQPPVPQRQTSRASETSFESVDPGEVTPPEESERALPEGISPISGLKYPRIPRSAGQMVPRSPPSPTPTRTRPHQARPAPRTRMLASARRGPNSAPTPERGDGDSWSAYDTPVKQGASEVQHRRRKQQQNNDLVTPPPRTSGPSGNRPKLSVFPNTTPTTPRPLFASRRVVDPGERGPTLGPTQKGDEDLSSSIGLR